MPMDFRLVEDFQLEKCFSIQLRKLGCVLLGLSSTERRLRTIFAENFRLKIRKVACKSLCVTDGEPVVVSFWRFAIGRI